MQPMKSIASILFAAALFAGCQNESKLDSSGGGGGGNLEARVKKLEETNAKYAEALDFLQKVYGQQKQQQQAQEREEPAPDAMRSEEHTSELQSLRHLVCRLLLE